MWSLSVKLFNISETYTFSPIQMTLQKFEWAWKVVGIGPTCKNPLWL